MLQPQPTSAIEHPRDLVGCLDRQEGFAEVVAELQAGSAATLDGVWGSVCALEARSIRGDR